MARRVVPIARQFQVAVQAAMADVRQAHIALAKREHARVMRTDPQPASFVRVVDGRLGAREEDVGAAGVIHYRYPRLELVAQFAMETLYDKSPVDSGDYRSAHTLFIDGIAVPNLEGWRPGQEISIGNPLPYARKIELGRMTMRVSGTDFVYEQAAEIVHRRYGNVAQIFYSWRSLLLPNFGLGGRAGGRAAGPAKRAAAAIERATRAPVLIISER